MLKEIKKVFYLFSRRQKKGFIILTFLVFVGMLLEIFGLGILIPAISILLDPDFIKSSNALSLIRDLLSNLSDLEFLYLSLIFIIIVFFVKTIYLIFLTYTQNKFLNNTIVNITNNLFKYYLSQEYIFHVNNNSSQLIKNLHIVISQLNTYLISFISLITEGGFLIAIISTLIYIEPLGAITIGLTYGLLSFVFLNGTKKKLEKWSKLRLEADGKVFKIASEGFGAIKDLLILNKANYFQTQFNTTNNLKGILSTKQSTLSQVPRFYFEFISVLGLMSFIVILLLKGIELNVLIGTIGVFVAATFRVIPSLNRIVTALQNLKFYKNSLDIVFNEIKDFSHLKRKQVSEKIENFENCIELKDISFYYKKENKIFENINLKIKKGESIGIIGESGSGKSTLVDLFIGLHKPTSGSIFIDKKEVKNNNYSLMNLVGYVSQTIYLTDDTIKNNIAFGVDEQNISEKKIYKIIKQVQLEKFINSLENGIETRTGERGVQLSGGQRQRIAIARALYNNPQIIILDEATSALDIETEAEIMKTISIFKGKKTIIIIAHRKSALTICDSIYNVKDKTIKT